MQNTPSKLVDYTTVAFLTLVWGLAWPVTVIGLRDCDPLVIASLRCTIGGIALFLWRARSATKEHFDIRTLGMIFIAGTCWVGIPMALTAWALQFITGGLGSVLQSTIPFFVALFAYFMLHESKLSTVKIVGLIIGFIGIIVLFSDDPFEAANWYTFAGGSAVLFSSVTIGFAQPFSRRFFKGRDRIGFNMYVLLFSGLEVLPFCFIGGSPRIVMSTELVLVLLYLGIIATAIPFALYFELFQRIDIVVLSMTAYVIPVVAVVSGILWLGERMTVADIAGSALVLFGVVLTTQYYAVKAKLSSRSIS
jgi:drug/metabolite transporter (DMT)-like permease